MSANKRRKRLPTQSSTPIEQKKKRVHINLTPESSSGSESEGEGKSPPPGQVHPDDEDASSEEESSSDEEASPAAKITREKASKITEKISQTKQAHKPKRDPHDKWKGANLIAHCHEAHGPTRGCFHQFVSPKEEPNANRKMKQQLASDRRLLCCNYCGEVVTLQNSKGVTTLKKHLSACKGPGARKLYHSLVLQPKPRPKAKAQPKQSSLSLHVVVKNKTWYKKDKGEKRNDLLAKLTKWVVMRSEPFSHVEDVNFRDIVDLFDPNAPVFAAETIKSNIVSLSLRFKEVVKKDLKNETLNLTTDHWTSPDGKSYCALTAHWINSEFELKSIVLGIFLYSLDDSRSKSLLVDFLLQLFEEFGFDELNVLSCVSDTTSSVNKFGIYLIDLGIEHVYCTDHVIQLTAVLAFDDKQYRLSEDDSEVDNLRLEDLLDKDFSVLKKARALVRYLKKSTINMEKLRRLQRSMETAGNNKRELQLVNDVVTRWWATLDMIERLLRLKPAILALFASAPDSLEKERELSDYDWTVLELISPVLKPFRTAQRFLEGQRYVTSSSVPIMITMIKRSLTAYKIEKDDTNGHSTPAEQAVLKLVNRMLGDLDDRWRDTDHKFAAKVERTTGNRQKGIHPLLWSAHYLDPRFKSLEYLSRDAEKTEEDINAGCYGASNIDCRDQKILKVNVQERLVQEAKLWRKEKGEPETSDSSDSDSDCLDAPNEGDSAVIEDEVLLMAHLRPGGATRSTIQHVKNKGLRDIVKEEMQRYDMKTVLAPQKNPLLW